MLLVFQQFPFKVLYEGSYQLLVSYITVMGCSNMKDQKTFLD